MALLQGKNSIPDGHGSFLIQGQRQAFPDSSRPPRTGYFSIFLFWSRPYYCQKFGANLRWERTARRGEWCVLPITIHVSNGLIKERPFSISRRDFSVLCPQISTGLTSASAVIQPHSFSIFQRMFDGCASVNILVICVYPPKQNISQARNIVIGYRTEKWSHSFKRHLGKLDLRGVQ